MTRKYARGKSVHDVFSLGKTKRDEVTDADRAVVLAAVLELGIDDGGWAVWRRTGVDRWRAVAIAGCAGWSDDAVGRQRVTYALSRYLVAA